MRSRCSAPLELDALDIAWRGGRGGVLAQTAGAEAPRRARRVARLIRDAGLHDVAVVDHDEALWERQRAGQRSGDRALVRVATRPAQLADVLREADRCGGTVISRAAVCTSYITVDPDEVTQLRACLPSGAVAVVLDGPAELRSSLDPWGVGDGAALELMRRVKARFDPARTCNPGVFIGGI
jgi:FAD/FMN-containing dehydrogenase